MSPEHRCPMLGGCLSEFAPWSEEDDALLSRSYTSGGIAAAKDAFPYRSTPSLYHRARRLGLSRRRRWTAADEKALRGLWEDGYSLRSIAGRLGRTQATTYWKAQQLGLPLGVPPGFESFTAAAERTGFAGSQLARVLEWAGLRPRRTLSRPCRSRTGWRHHFVDPLDVDDAIAAWLKTETPEAAARRIGIDGTRLRARLREVGIRSPGGRRPMRVTEAEVEKANAIARWEKRNRRVS